MTIMPYDECMRHHCPECDQPLRFKRTAYGVMAVCCHHRWTNIRGERIIVGERR